MRPILALAAAVMLAAPALFAHDPSAGAGDPNQGMGAGPDRWMGPGMGGPRFDDQFLGRLKGQVGIKPEQESKIKAIMEKSKAETEKLRDQMREVHKKMEDHDRQTMENIRAVLDLDQKEKYDQLRAGLTPHPGPMGGPHPMGGGPLSGPGGPGGQGGQPQGGDKSPEKGGGQ